MKMHAEAQGTESSQGDLGEAELSGPVPPSDDFLLRSSPAGRGGAGSERDRGPHVGTDEDVPVEVLGQLVSGEEAPHAVRTPHPDSVCLDHGPERGG